MAKVARVYFDPSLSGITAATAAPTTSANGVAVPDGKRGEWVHLLSCKNAAITGSLWGYAVDVGQWATLDTFSMAESNNQVQLFRCPSCFSRIATQISTIGTNGTCNTHLGFSEV